MDRLQKLEISLLQMLAEVREMRQQGPETKKKPAIPVSEITAQVIKSRNDKIKKS